MLLVNSQSGVKYVSGKRPVYFSEAKEFEKHYFTKDHKIYFRQDFQVCHQVQQKDECMVLHRLSKLYDDILIDEVQDLAGYDLELLKLIFKSPIRTLLVGDPRQGTYSTNSSSKNKQFKKSGIVYFFEDGSIDIKRDTKTLVINYRSVPAICALSNRIFPEHEADDLRE